MLLKSLFKVLLALLITKSSLAEENSQNIKELKTALLISKSCHAKDQESADLYFLMAFEPSLQEELFETFIACALSFYEKDCEENGTNCLELGELYEDSALQEDFKKAIWAYERARANLPLGLIYRQIGHEQRAQKYFKLACDEKNSEACFLIAKDEKSILHACELGSAKACLKLGQELEGEAKSKEDLEQIMSYYQKSCAILRDACLALERLQALGQDFFRLKK